ncbi:hypothetical protein B0A48_15794 [Cryoendolithus antarcticus]|uniref:Developmental regulatory protein wetA n=1 Tax=Cryoendolithus antarcticus TaxID=1507870 RepID=A0A1V8SHG2_9PEZI|nr:hypothetical protein B0A48_15794 [Cryoendolithus antarcticus]
MAYLQLPIQLPIRPPSHKETEWASFCNNVFDEYLDVDDLFGLGGCRKQERNSSSDDSVNLFDFSGSSEQSGHTAGTSPLAAWQSAAGGAPFIEARQPKPEASIDFWQKTLKALEQNAAESEQKQRSLRTTKSHPDLLSLGGCPSPPAVPSQIDQSLSVQRRRGPRQAANGKRVTSTTARSVSRGRPAGVAKPATAAAAANVSPRKPSASPHKMMTPSRFRAGFKDVWADKSSASPKKCELHVPPHRLPVSPPPSARTMQEDFAAFGSPPAFDPLYGDELSPLTTSFQQQARIHTPNASPGSRKRDHVEAHYFDGIPAVPPNPYAPQAIPLNDAQPLFPERTSSLAPARMPSFDFGFDTTPSTSTWESNATAFAHNAYTTDPFTNSDPFGSVVPTTEIHSPLFSDAGLGISCEPTLTSPYTSMAAIAPMTAPMYGHFDSQGHLYHGLPSNRAATTSRTVPNTPHHAQPRSQRHSAFPSLSPSPTPRATPSRSRGRGSKPPSHRRAKSMASTIRHPSSAQAEKLGFVNFTPHDSGKILSGVAPSGSSKTKARREKEAADKRRWLSAAAVKAVVEAGGDIEGLRGVLG